MMKKKTNVLIVSIIALFGFFVMVFPSCTKEKGCRDGYFGENCDRQIRSLVLGTYQASDTVKTEEGKGEIKAYSFKITKGDSSIRSVNITNFVNSGITIKNVETRWLKGEDAIVLVKNGQIVNNDTLGMSFFTYDGDTKTITADYELKTSNGGIGYMGAWTKE